MRSGWHVRSFHLLGRGWRSRAGKAVALLGVPALLLGGAGTPPAVPEPAPAETISPEGLTELRSVNGVLSATLVAAAGKVHLGQFILDGMTYNGQYAGPVLRLHPGDTLRLHLQNDMTRPTNIHFHGMQTTPLEHGDNVHITVAAGQSYDYEVPIPRTQPPGLYYYHSHLHGLAEEQVMGGLSGALVVEGLAEQFPQLAGVTEKLFVLKEMSFPDDTGDDRIDDDLHGIIKSINGKLHSDIAMRPGETQLWRFGNQSPNLLWHLALAGHRFRIIAQDGVAATGETETEVLDVKPASRVEVLVDAGAAGNYALVARGTPTGSGPAMLPDRELGTLVVAGPPATPVAKLEAFPPSPDLRVAHIDAQRRIVFSQTYGRNPAAQKFFIDDKMFEYERIDTRVPLGNVEEWTIRNDSDDMHVFHIHQVTFQVVEVNGKPVPYTGRVDTAKVPERGEIKVRMAFTNPLIVGRFMYHCHILRHEDRGMMANIEVYDPHASNLAPARLLRGARQFAWHVWRWLCGVPWQYCGSAWA